jgi:hypothetical protein
MELGDFMRDDQVLDGSDTFGLLVRVSDVDGGEPGCRLDDLDDDRLEGESQRGVCPAGQALAQLRSQLGVDERELWADRGVLGISKRERRRSHAQSIAIVGHAVSPIGRIRTLGTSH